MKEELSLQSKCISSTVNENGRDIYGKQIAYSRNLWLRPTGVYFKKFRSTRMRLAWIANQNPTVSSWRR